MAASTAPVPSRSTDLQKILIAGALVALLDGLFAVGEYAWVMHVSTAPRIFQSIAAALYGKDSFGMGMHTIILGVILHCAVAYTWTIVGYVALRAIPAFGRAAETTAGAILLGLVLGAIIWPFMDLVVIPFTRSKPMAPSNKLFYVQLAWHMIGLGPTIVWITRPRRAPA